MSSPRPDISIVTVNYKVADLVGELIRSVPAACGELRWEMFVVDNASGDGSAERIRRDFPQVTVLASDTNLGFGRGNNLGAARATGEYLALVNPDVVLPPGSMAQLVAFLKAHPRIGLVGPRVQLPDGSTQSSPKQLPNLWDVVRILPGVSRASAYWSNLKHAATGTAPEPCGVIHGSCMLFRREVYERVDGMPKNVFMYGEEPIMGHRVKQAGWEVWYNPLVHVLHQDEACADKRWVPHQKALRKRNGHISAHSEIWPRAMSITWNALMATSELSRAAASFLRDPAASERHLDFARLHMAGMKRTKSAQDPLSD